MYFVDRKKMEATLLYMEKLTPLMGTMDDDQTMKNALASERLAMVMIESVIDVGNQMIDGFIMRDPGGYEDIVDILHDESVIEKNQAEELKTLIRFRKKLTYEFVDLKPSEVVAVLKESASGIQDFPEAIRAYLRNELGPVSAFLPSEEEV
ncbi:DUF86 domain-containing protein [Shouchella shacheensis]|uniref:DUF86 domain-containing protein n=1 Tax=Shouchella shacheensis TaxID=1649580 RepID=UPI00074047C9|nr:DUF86 domain-containing protein [Shouchella shacheensis]